MTGFDFHVHGLWILGSFAMMAGALLAGNIEWVEGTTPVSFGVALILALVMFLSAGVLWISSAANVEQR
ncbi:MAG: hypothetical protein J4431_04650 [Candidatus Aenigmarchaeota archaeon]|nr:hypothetical protein [Candidatus Aenigmarchaeota archaeon]